MIALLILADQNQSIIILNEIGNKYTQSSDEFIKLSQKSFQRYNLFSKAQIGRQ